MANLFKQSRKKNASLKKQSEVKRANANAQVAGLRFTKKSAGKPNDNEQPNTSTSYLALDVGSTTTVTIDSLDWMGQGVTRGKTTFFVQGALPGETCDVEVLALKKNVAQAKALRVVTAKSEHRTVPFCPVFNECGGCQLQHIEPEAALSLRDSALCDMMMHQLDMPPSAWQAPLSGERPQYRRKARLAIDARNSDNIKLGFRAAGSNKVVNIQQCPILAAPLSALPGLLNKCLSGFESARHIGHISLIAPDPHTDTQETETNRLASKVAPLVTIKHTKSLEPALINAVRKVASEHAFSVVFEDKKGTMRSLFDATRETQSTNVLPEVRVNTIDGFWLTPSANDFVQVNKVVNEKMIRQALHWLNVQSDERVADWFSGLGNFTLPLANAVTKTGAQVQAIEGVAEMVQRAKANALAQGINNVDWLHLDLSDEANVQRSLEGGFHKVLLDPSREGALTVCHALVKAMPKAIVYVSCNPSTFARDAKVLLDGGYAIEKAGAVEMFPFTHHMEMMALFTAKPQ